jgi:DNA-binding GntR family transcriptional regulator
MQEGWVARADEDRADVMLPPGEAAALRPARRGTIAMQVYGLIRHNIVTARFQPGQRLSEKELAASLKISRTPVREAFGKLEEEGLISILPQHGTFVAPTSPDTVANSRFVREAIECAAIAEAARRCTMQMHPHYFYRQPDMPAPEREHAKA